VGIIHELPVELSNQIAAGEVIERPASVVKELVENSIDAKATQILITVQESGIKSIEVNDNGKGISADDVEVAFLPHTTSKIATDHDLFNVRTLGFRGEALASIASVSKLTVLTSTDGKSAVKAKFSGNELIKKETFARWLILPQNRYKQFCSRGLICDDTDSICANGVSKCNYNSKSKCSFTTCHPDAKITSGCSV